MTTPTVKYNLVKGAGTQWNLSDQEIMLVAQVQNPDLSQPGLETTNAMFAVGYSVGDQLDEVGYENFYCSQISTDSEPEAFAINVYVRFRYRRFVTTYLKSCGGTLRQIPVVPQIPIGITAPPAAPGYVIYGPATITYTPSSNGNASIYTLAGPIVSQETLIEGTISFQVLEQFDPEAYNLYFAGCVNQRTWRGYAPRTLLFLPIQSSTDDGITFLNVYTFDYRPETHDQYIFYTNTETGETPPEVAQDVVYDGSRTSGNGWRRCQTLIQADFGYLFIDIIDDTAPPIDPDVLNYAKQIGAATPV